MLELINIVLDELHEDGFTNTQIVLYGLLWVVGVAMLIVLSCLFN